MKELSESPDACQFLEATVYSKETSVIMKCNFADVTNKEQKSKVNGVNYFWLVAVVVVLGGGGVA